MTPKRKMIFISPQAHAKLKAIATKNKRTLIAEVDVLLKIK